jgi:hypothetical protein
VTRKVFLILLALALALSVGLVACTPTEEEEEEEEQVSISDLKGPDWQGYVGTEVTIEGIFVRDPIPMLVTDLDIVKMNTPMPDDQYIILVGDIAEDIDPYDYGGAKVEVTGVVTEMNDPEDWWEYVAIDATDLKWVLLIEEWVARILEVEHFPPPVFQNRYAVLFSGGINPSNNKIRYWNDLTFMYAALINNGYPAGHITVLYADGSARDAQMPVDGSATQANLEAAFNTLKQTTTSQDTIFVFTTNHGGGFYPPGWPTWQGIQYVWGGQVDGNGDEPGDVLLEADYSLDLNGDGDTTDTVSWDEELCAWQGSIYDEAFGNMFANLNYRRMIIVMEQCFSGGLIADMAGTNRIIMSAASEYEFSWAMSSDYDEFSYYFTCAINGADPQGNAVNADTSMDGKVSMLEAFEYARQHDSQNEQPQYEDNGTSGDVFL